jgi:hypothetical protein
MFIFKVKGEAKLYGAIGRVSDALSDFRRRWRRNITIRLAHQRDWMDTQGRGSWPKLTDTYLERKSHNPKAAFVEILKFTGHLYRSLVEPGSPDSFIEEDKTRLVMGTIDPKGRLHHEGRGRLPVRRVIVIDDDERREHAEALYESVADVARAEGFAVMN